MVSNLKHRSIGSPHATLDSVVKALNSDNTQFRINASPWQTKRCSEPRTTVSRHFQWPGRLPIWKKWHLLPIFFLFYYLCCPLSCFKVFIITEALQAPHQFKVLFLSAFRNVCIEYIFSQDRNWCITRAGLALQLIQNWFFKHWLRFSVLFSRRLFFSETAGSNKRIILENNCSIELNSRVVLEVYIYYQGTGVICPPHVLRIHLFQLYQVWLCSDLELSQVEGGAFSKSLDKYFCRFNHRFTLIFCRIYRMEHLKWDVLSFEDLPWSTNFLSTKREDLFSLQKLLCEWSIPSRRCAGPWQYMLWWHHFVVNVLNSCRDILKTKFQLKQHCTADHHLHQVDDLQVIPDKFNGVFLNLSSYIASAFLMLSPSQHRKKSRKEIF